MKTKKKLLAAAVSAVLMLSAMPFSAGAAMTGPADSVMQMYERIAEWENVSLEDCYIKVGDVRDVTLFTPNKPYSITIWNRDPFRVTVKPGTTLTPEDVSDAWRAYMTALGQIDNAYGLDTVPEVTETETEGTYLVYLEDAWRHGVYIFPDSLTLIPQVERIEGKYGYHTDSRANYGEIPFLVFQCDITPTAEDFPGLNVKSIRYDESFYNAWLLELNEKNNYREYVKAYQIMQSLDYVHDLYFPYSETALYDTSEDVSIPIGDYETVFLRGDLNKDGEVDVMDAVLLARLTAEDTDIPVSESGIVNADADGDGLLTLRDVTLILEKAACF